MTLSCRHARAGLFAVLLGLFSAGAARADEIFVTNAGADTIGEYTTAGATVNAALISGLNFPEGIALSGSDLFVVNSGVTGRIGEYTTAGATALRALRCLALICLSRTSSLAQSANTPPLGRR
jgi:hypothetical protein